MTNVLDETITVGGNTLIDNFNVTPLRAHPKDYDYVGDPGGPPVPTDATHIVSFTPDGHFALYTSDAINLADGITNPADVVKNLYRVDLRTGEIVCVSTNASGETGNTDSAVASRNVISDDGNYVVFSSASTNLIPGDTRTYLDATQIVYMKNIATGEIRPLDGDHATAAFVDAFAVVGPAFGPTQLSDSALINYKTQQSQTILSQSDIDLINLNGSVINTSFQTSIDGKAELINVAYTDLSLKAYWKDMVTGAFKLVNSPSLSGTLSGDGRTVVFLEVVDGVRQIYAENMDTEVVRLVSSNPSGFAANADVLLQGISSDGRYIAFSTAADNLVRNDHNANDTTFGQDTFVKDMQTGAVRFLDGTTNVDHFLAVASFVGDLAYISTNDPLVPAAGDGQFFHDYLHDISYVDPLPASKAGVQADVSGSADNSKSDAHIASLATGKYVVTWTDAPVIDPNADPDAPISPTQIKAQLYNSDGTKSGSAVTVSSDTTDDQAVASVTGLSGGAYIVTWIDRHIDPSTGISHPAAVHGQLFNSDGTKNGAELDLVDGNQDTISATVASLSDGGFVLLSTQNGFTNDGTTSTSAERFDASGVALGAVGVGSTQYTTNTSGAAAAGLHDGGFVIVYRELNGNGYNVDESDGVFAKIFAADGTSASEFQVNITAEGTQGSPAVATLASGNFVVSWSDQGEHIRAQLFTAGGSKVGSEFLVGDSTGAPTVAALADGRFVIAWNLTTTDSQGTHHNIAGQLFNADGTKSFDVFSFDLAPDGLDNFDPSVTALANGSFVIAATETDLGSTWDIISQRFGFVSASAESAPVAVTDNVSLVTGRTLKIVAATLLGNDTDADGDKLIITAASQGTHGGVTFDSKTGTILYNPAGGYVGLDQFTYTIDDGQGGHSTGTVIVTVNPASANHAPKAPLTPLALSTAERTSISGQLAATDQDGDTLTYTLVKTVAGLTLNGDGSFTYNPIAGGLQHLADGQTAAVTFQATASDGLLSSTAFTTTINVTGLNDSPIANDDQLKIILANSKPITISIASLLKNDIDPDTGDKISMFPVDEQLRVVSGQSEVDYGSIKTGTGGNLIFTPNANALSLSGAQTITAYFTYGLHDQHSLASGTSATVAVTLHGPDAAPKVAAGSVATTEDTPIANAHVTPGTDANGDPLTYALVKNISGLSFNDDGTFSFDPTVAGFNNLVAGQKATVAFQFTASDGFLSSAAATESIVITGVNDSPSANSDLVGLMLAGSKAVTIAPATLLKNDTDPDKGDVLKIVSVDGTSLTNGTVSLDAKTGNIIFTPTSDAALHLHGASHLTDSFTYTIEDKAHAHSTGTATLTLAGPDATPKALAGTATGDEDHLITGTVTGSDADSDSLSFVLSKSVAGLTLSSEGHFTYDPTVAFNSLGAGQKGTLAFQFTASDGVVTSSAATETITVSGVNDAPVAHDDLLTYTGAAHASLKITAATLLKNDIDPDKGDAPTLSLVGSDGHFGTASIVQGAVVYTPTDTIFTIATGVGSLSLTDSFSETVIDKAGLSSTARVDLTLTGQSVTQAGMVAMTAADDLLVLDLAKLSNAVIASNGAVTGLVTINGFSAAHDHFDTFNDATMSLADSMNYDALPNLKAAAEQAAHDMHSAGHGGMFFHFGDSTYLLTDHGGDGHFNNGDGLIRFVGVDLTPGSVDPAWHHALTGHDYALL